MEMLEQVSNFEQEIKFIIGFAGSGKSTKLASMVNDKTIVLTPTHKAAQVLRDKGVENVFTIHAVLKLVPTLNQSYNPLKNQRMQRLRQMGTTDLADMTDIFIDEFSMLSQDILDLLLELLPEHCKVTVFGDPYQLATIEGEAIDPTLYTDDIEELTVQHRAEAPEVIESFMRFMNYIKNGSEMNLALNPAIKKGTLKGFNPDTDRALAFTNKKVLEMNQEIAKNLGLPKSFSYGEPLIANSLECSLAQSDHNPRVFPNCISKGKLMPEELLVATVAKTMSDIAKFNNTHHTNHPQCSLTIEGKDYLVHYDADHYHTQQQLKAEIDKWQGYLYSNNTIPEDMKLKDWCYHNKGAKGIKERGKAWSRYIAHSNLVFNLQRPFASTCHKAQGQEFKTVYIAQDDIKKSISPGYYGTYSRLMYVALSRAIEKVLIV